ncbi:hypothetical protein [Pseudomonas fluorescens]|uniref:Uncharacterized protein n=1 Tax=Pseudomonas fluorescens TaxID=294 RepID=A0A0D0NPT3_PSEFL|nr:hypothetical protein [Pseudomonas fluorescens]KIQ61101.1 hypothetical protein RL74_01865 [Pseudomonas fluorescens]
MANHRLRDRVIENFVKSWSRAKPPIATLAVEALTDLYDRFREAGLADRTFEQQLTSGQPATYEQRMGELLLADMLWRDGFSLESNDEGPDFFVSKDGKSAWIELHTPDRSGIPLDYFDLSTPGLVKGVPHTEINLRWTTAIDQKKGQLKKYINSGIVKADQPYIIAVNSRLLNPFKMTGINGVSGKPIAVEVLFSVGPVQIQIDRLSGEVVDQFHQHRPFLDKPGTESKVESDSFHNPDNARISAVLGVDLLEQVTALGGEHPSALVYNPLATTPIAQRWINAQEHWHCTIEPDSYLVQRLEP